MALGDEEGVYLENMLNYVVALANQRGTTLNSFLEEIEIPEPTYVYPYGDEEEVRDLRDIVENFRAPEIPEDFDAAEYRDLADEVKKKILVPMLSGAVSAASTIFPCRADLLSDEITALGGALDGTLLASDADRLLDIQMQRGKDQSMLKFLNSAAEIISAGSEKGFPVMPGFVVGGLQSAQLAALRASSEARAEAVGRRLETAAKMLRGAINAVLGYRQLILGAMLDRMKAQISALRIGVSLADATASQERNLINAVSGYISSLQRLESLRLRSVSDHKALERGLKLGDNARANQHVESKMKAVAEITSVLSNQAAGALNTLSARGSVSHQVG